MWWIVVCAASTVKKTAGALEPSRPSFLLGMKIFLAFVDGNEVCLSRVPGFVGRKLDFPRLHFLVVEHFRGQHALDVMLYLRGLRGRDTC